MKNSKEKASRTSVFYEVHTISFKTFFEWAFKIVIDSWKFTMLLLYILWDDWPIFMISGSNQQLQQQWKYTLLKPDCHSWWISKLQSDTLEERYAIKLCFKLGKHAAIETYGMLQTAFRASCMNRASVFKCHKRFKKRLLIKWKTTGSSWQRKKNRRYPEQTITDAVYANDIALLANTPTQAETLLHNLERAVASIGLRVNADKTEYMGFNQRGVISILNGSSLKLVDKFTYLGTSVSSTETDIHTRLAKAWTAIDSRLVIWKSDLTDKIKLYKIILLYGCTTWTLTILIDKMPDDNYTRMLRAILNKSWWQHPTKYQL